MRAHSIVGEIEGAGQLLDGPAGPPEQAHDAATSAGEKSLVPTRRRHGILPSQYAFIIHPKSVLSNKSNKLLTFYRDSAIVIPSAATAQERSNGYGEQSEIG